MQHSRAPAETDDVAANWLPCGELSGHILSIRIAGGAQQCKACSQVCPSLTVKSSVQRKCPYGKQKNM